MKTPKKLFSQLFLKYLTGVYCLFLLAGCQEDETGMVDAPPFKNSVTYMLIEKSDSGLNGYVTFSESDDQSIVADLHVAGTESGNAYPAHVHFNSAAEGGDVAITLEPVDGSKGNSLTTFSKTDSGEPISFANFLDFNGYVNVHKSANDIATVCQGDIGGNHLTGDTKQYTFSAVNDSEITGAVTFAKRKNGNTLVTVALDTTISDAKFPASIHVNSAVMGGDVAISLNPIDGNTGKSVTSVKKLDDGVTAITYDELADFNGYVSIHQSEVDMTTIAHTDIGSNELSGKSVTYDLDVEAAGDIKGTATFAERKNGQTLVTIALEGTALQGTYPAHIHAHTAAESGDIMISLHGVHAATDTTGLSVTNVAALDNGTAITYEELTNYDGYLNVQTEPGAIVAQGDIGENALTGESVAYPLGSVAVTDIKGKATFYQRKSGLTLVTIALEGTDQGASHPAHIHFNTAVEGGDIAVTLHHVDGNTGISKTTIRQFNSGGPVTYEELINYDGYINAHQSEGDMATLVAQGDIGSNALTDNKIVYTLNAVDNSGISGTATIAERKSGAALVTLQLSGTSTLGNHPAHIHYNSAEKGGAIAISLNSVNGTGMSKTNIEKQDNKLDITYDALLGFNGYINIHQSPLDLDTIVAQGNIGANVEVE